MATLLQNLRINRVAAVDKGAGEDVRVIFWKRDIAGGKVIKGLSSDAIASIAAKSVRGETKGDILKAIQALDGSVLSIAGAATDAGAATVALETTFKQFTAHVTGLGLEPQAAEKLAADIRAVHPLLTKGDDDMTPEELKKLLGEEITKANKPLLDTIAAQAHDLSVLKMSPVAKSFYDALATDDLKKAFAAKKPADQDDEADKSKTSKALPSEITKALEPILKTNEDLTKRNGVLETTVKAMTERDEVQSFEKRAVDLGLPVAHGAIMRKAYAGDPAAMAEHEKMLKGLVEQVRTGKTFAEFGKGAADGGTGATAYDQLVAKAEEIRKAAKDPLTKEQAFTKAYVDPANQEIVAQHKRDELSKRRAA